MARRHQRDTQPPPAESLTQAIAGLAAAPPAPDARDDRPPSWEDFVAARTVPTATEQNSALPPDEPNADLSGSPYPVCADPLWECTCPGEPLPRATVQAPNAQMAEERYRQRFLIRRPKVTVTRL